MDLKQIQFRIIKTEYDKITIKDDSDILISKYDDDTKLYNYIVVMSHNPEFQHDTNYLDVYESQWDSYENMKKIFYESDIRNEKLYKHIQNMVLKLLENKYGEFDDFTRNIRRYDPMLLTENKHLSVFGFDALKNNVDTVMKFINNMVEKLNQFYGKYEIRFQLDEKMDSIDENKEIILSKTEFKNIALVNNLLF